jgi:hypothetical protein
VTARWEVRNGDLAIRNTSAHGTVTLRRNGVVNNSIPLEIKPSTTPYRCFGNTLREYHDRDGNGVTKLTRQTTPPLKTDTTATGAVLTPSTLITVTRPHIDSSPARSTRAR